MGTDLNKTKEVFGFLLAQELAKDAPKVTSRLARSFPATLQYTDKGFSFTLPDYAASVINGSVPHIIRPKNKSVLKFEKEGKTIFAKEVHHPGNEPNFFIQEVLRTKTKDLLLKAFKASTK